MCTQRGDQMVCGIEVVRLATARIAKCLSWGAAPGRTVECAEPWHLVTTRVDGGRHPRVVSSASE